MSLIIRYADPLWTTGGVPGDYTDTEPNSYSHSEVAVGGYESATIQLATSRAGADEWMDRGVGYHVETIDAARGVVWEGYVDEIEVRYGPVVYKIGPLTSVANKIGIVYQTLSYTALGITIGGDRRFAGWYNNRASQMRYGIIEQIYSAGQTPEDLANQLGLTHLREKAEPQRGTDVSLQAGSAGTFGVNLRCKGYYHLLKNYYYYSDDAEFIPGQTKISRAVNADPNGLFTLERFNTNLAYGIPVVMAYEDKDRSAWDIVTEQISLGDTQNNRVLFGVYQDRTAWCYTMPQEIQYLYHLSDPTQRVSFVTGGQASYWDIRAGQWMQVADMMVAGRTDDGDLFSSRRNIFMESTEYQLPLYFRASSGDKSVANMMLARFGLGSYS